MLCHIPGETRRVVEEPPEVLRMEGYNLGDC